MRASEEEEEYTETLTFFSYRGHICAESQAGRAARRLQDHTACLDFLGCDDRGFQWLRVLGRGNRGRLTLKNLDNAVDLELV